MKVILKSDVPNLGRAGDIKEVKNGYARNYLIPRNLVMTADAKTRKQQDFIEKVRQSKIQKRKKTAQETVNNLKGKTIEIRMKVGDNGKLFGSVTNLHIQKELEKEGIVLDKKYILVSEPLKNLGEYQVEVKIYDDIAEMITVRVADEEGSIEVKVVEEEVEDSNEESAAEAGVEEATEGENQEESTEEPAE